MKQMVGELVALIGSSAKDGSGKKKPAAQTAHTVQVFQHGMAPANADPCWDMKNCPTDRRESCPAYPNTGNKCWMVTGTMCGGNEQGSYHEKISKCKACDVYVLNTGHKSLKLPSTPHTEKVNAMDDADFKDF